MSSIIDRIAHDLSLDQSCVSSIIRGSNFYYKKFEIPKRNGGTRLIYQASPELKSLQYWVRENILRYLPVSAASFAYKSGDSIKKHAAFHQNAHFIFHTDIESYFPSIYSKMLTDILVKNSDELNRRGVWFDDSCATISKICFLNNRLSIGTVSSPIISNIVAYDFDECISSYCEQNGYKYSRYADDIYISSNTYIPGDTKNLVKDCLFSHGFRMNESKTWFRSSKSRRKITGLVITDTGRVSVGTETRRKIKHMIYNRLVNGDGEPDKILGYLAYLKDIEPQVYNRYIIKYSAYCDGDIINAIRRGPQKTLLKEDHSGIE